MLFELFHDQCLSSKYFFSQAKKISFHQLNFRNLGSFHLPIALARHLYTTIVMILTVRENVFARTIIEIIARSILHNLKKQ